MCFENLLPHNHFRHDGHERSKPSGSNQKRSAAGPDVAGPDIRRGGGLQEVGPDAEAVRAVGSLIADRYISRTGR